MRRRNERKRDFGMRKGKAVIFAIVFSVLFGTTCSAAINFDVTVNKAKKNEDNYSKKVTKNGGSMYENRFYVTPKKFIIKDKVNVFSRQEDNVNCTSYPRQLAPSEVNKTVSNPYLGNAPANKIYRLHAYFGGSVGSARVQGSFSP